MLKVGDRVKIVGKETCGDCGNYFNHDSMSQYVGDVFTIESVRSNGRVNYGDSRSLIGSWEWCEHWLESVDVSEKINSEAKPKNTMRVKLSIIAKKLLDGNTKTLVKAGFLDEQLNVTDLGNENLTSICFEASKEALVVLAEEAIKEAKEAKK